MKDWMNKKIISKPLFLVSILSVVIIFFSMGTSTLLNMRIYYGEVAGESMMPTIKEEMRLLLVDSQNKEIKRGEIVSVEAYLEEDGENINVLKRVVGLPNETIMIQGNSVYINGNLLDEPYAYYSSVSNDNLNFKLNDDEYFIMGDNRMGSFDSRIIGAIPRKAIIGKVVKYR